MIDALAEWRDNQLESWESAKANYDALAQCERREFAIGPLKGAFQYNPHRKVSTGAKIDSASISKRPCFLCECNRPSEQIAEEIIEGWVFLVNPFPIFPLHFTLASKTHKPQESIPLEMASLAEKLPGMVVFYNGAKAGASAPDHLHCQAVMKSELPLMVYLEEGGDPAALPFKVRYSVITPDMQGMIDLNTLVAVTGTDTEGNSDRELVNAYCWIGIDGLLRMCVIPRKAHRPACYTSAAEGEGRMISPGAIDMAGIVILPRLQDFEGMTSEEMAEIYNQTALRQ